MEHFSTEIYNTTKVTKQLRKNVWDKNNDMNSINLMDSICTICSSHITYDTFECGHIIPRIRGGLTTIDNLERICKQCNRDMGRMNLLIYKQIYAKQTSTSTSTST
jgi:5-methylcytosine-specific restriction endonuclease McrA